MDALRRIVATIRNYLGKMSITQRLLMASLTVIVVMSLVMVSLYAGRGDRELLDGVRATPEVMTLLRTSGIAAEVGPEGVTVPTGTRERAIAELSQGGELPNDTVVLFNNLGAKHDWRFSREQNRRMYIFALQNELSRVLGKFRGVRSASVILDIPEAQGLGRAARDPTGSVTLVTSGGPLTQGQVDAAASLVAGSVAGLAPDRVEVIDAVAGRTRRARNPDDVASSTYMEHRAKVERTLRERVEAHLSYIPGVMVAVTADVDVTRVSQSTKRHLEKGQGTVSLPKRDTSESLTETNAALAAEPGIRSNQGASINTSPSSAGSQLEQTQADTEFDNAIGTEVREVIDPRGAPRYLAVSVNVPEGFVRSLLEREAEANLGPAGGQGGGQGGGDPPEIGRAQIDDRFAALRAQVEGSLRPLLKTRLEDGSLTDGELSVAMVPVDLPLAPMTQSAGMFGLFAGDGSGGGGPLGLGSGGVLDTALVGLTALVALGLMVMLVRRSGKKLDLPSAEELVGIPPPIGLDADVIGEAGEGDAPMAGIEVDESDLRRQKMLDQIGEMIANDPPKAAKLMTRWMAVEE